MTNVKNKTNTSKAPPIAPGLPTRHLSAKMLSPEAIERIASRDVDSDTWEETDEVVQLEVKKPLKVVVPVRLSAEKWEELHKVAEELGIGPTTLARMWILERLQQKIKTGV